MRRGSPRLTRHFARPATIARAGACLLLLAAPAWALTDRAQPADNNQIVSDRPVQVTETDRQRVCEEAQPSKAQTYQQQASQENRALEQKPTLTDDVRLRAETYTGNDYSK